MFSVSISILQFYWITFACKKFYFIIWVAHMRISKRTKNVLVYLVLLPATFPAISTILKFVRCIKSITIRISIFSSFPILNKFDLSIANFFKDLYLIALRIHILGSFSHSILIGMARRRWKRTKCQRLI